MTFNIQFVWTVEENSVSEMDLCLSLSAGSGRACGSLVRGVSEAQE